MAEDIRTMADTTGVREFEKKFERPYCILLDSEYCSMGRMIANKACKKAGYAYYDAVILLEGLNDPSVTIETVENFEKKLRDENHELNDEELKEYERIRKAFEAAADIALKKGPCLIHDRISRQYVVSKAYSVFSVLTYATDLKAKRVRARLSPLYKDIADNDLLDEKIKEEDRIRSRYHALSCDSVWGDTKTYDLCLNSETLGLDRTAEVLASFMI